MDKEDVEERIATTKTCRECPFSRKSAPEWLGDSTPKEFVDMVMADKQIPCHLTINYENSGWVFRWEEGLEGALCAGALIFFANICKLSRDPTRPRVGQDHDAVFSRPEEMIAHHTLKAELPMDPNVMRYMVNNFTETQFQKLVEELAWLEMWKSKLEEFYHPHMNDSGSVDRRENPFYRVTLELTGHGTASWIEISVKGPDRSDMVFDKLKIHLKPVGDARLYFCEDHNRHRNIKGAVHSAFESKSFYTHETLCSLQMVTEATELDHPKYGSAAHWKLVYTGDSGEDVDG